MLFGQHASFFCHKITAMISFISRVLQKILFFFIHCLLILCLFFGSLVLHYSQIKPEWLGDPLAGVFFVIGLVGWWLFLTKRRFKPLGVAAILFAAILVYWAAQEPSNDREWRADVSKVAKAEFIDKDTVRIINYRNFDYRSRDDFTPRYEERTINLSHLTSVDYYISYWGSGPADCNPVGHTFLSFNFDNAAPVTISIEARFEKHEGFDPLASLFRQFDLIYVVGDENDIVRVRTNFRDEEVLRYPLNVSPEAARKLLDVYLERINQLYERPEFYNLFSNNCTLNIFRYANKVGRTGSWEFRVLLNGLSDRYLFESGFIDTKLTFRQLRRQAEINDLANEKPEHEDFSKAIRQRLPNHR